MNQAAVRRICTIVSILSFVLTTGCSTRRARMQDVSITTDPAGMRATIEDRSCITPCTLTDVRRTAEYVVFEQGAHRHKFALDKKEDRMALRKVDFIGLLKIGLPALIITDSADEIQPINVKFTGPADAPLLATTGIDGTGGVREVRDEEAAVASVIGIMPIPSPEPKERPFAVSAGAYIDFITGGRAWTSVLKFEQRFFRSNRITWYANVGYSEYRSIRNDYSDKEYGMGGELGMNFYSGDRTLKKLYFGFGIGNWKYKGSWRDDVGTPFETKGRGTASAREINIHYGYKWFPLGDNGLFIDPSIALALVFDTGEPPAFGPAGTALTAGLNIGKRW